MTIQTRDPAMEAWFEGIQIGVPLPTFERLIDAALIERYAKATGTTVPWFRGPSPFGGPILPPSVLPQICTGLGALLIGRPPKGGGVAAMWDVQHHAPVPVNTRLTLGGSLVEKDARRDKYFFVTQVWARNEAGEEVWTARQTRSLMAHGSMTRQRSAQDTPETPVAGRKVSLVSPDIPEGDEIPPLVRTFSFPMMQLHSGWPQPEMGRSPINQHTSDAVAQRWGLPEAVVAGAHLTSGFDDLMLHNFGARWLSGGRLAVRMIGITRKNTRLIYKAKVTGKSTEAGGTRIHMNAWATNPRGGINVIGTASCLV